MYLHKCVKQTSLLQISRGWNFENYMKIALQLTREPYIWVWVWGLFWFPKKFNCFPQPLDFSTGFVMNSKLSFSRLFQKIVGEKHIIFPERQSENYIIFPENQWNKRRDIETNVSITIRAGIKQSPKQDDVGLVLYQDWKNT